MEKKSIIIRLLVVGILITALITAWIGVAIKIIDVQPSPDGEYQIVSWLIDQGAWGYRGAYYIKEKGLFSRWHKLGTGPFGGEWLSETEFSIYDDSYTYTEYTVDEFFEK